MANKLVYTLARLTVIFVCLHFVRPCKGQLSSGTTMNYSMLNVRESLYVDNSSTSPINNALVALCGFIIVILKINLYHMFKMRRENSNYYNSNRNDGNGL